MEQLFDPCDPLGDRISSCELIQSVGDDAMICAAARVSYGNDLKSRSDEENFKLIRYLLKHQHGSPLEHNLITYRVKAPLYVVQEMLRHRVGTNFNQQSHRYLDLTQQKAPAEFYIPQVFRGQSKSNRQASVASETLDQAHARQRYQEGLTLAYQAYEDLIQSGVAREQARGLIPHCTYTSLYFTVNVRSLLHFLGLRLSPDAQWEIQQYALSFKALAEPIFPQTFRAWTELNP